MRIRTAACCAFLTLLLWLTGCQQVGRAANRYMYDPSRAKPADVSLNKLPLAEPDAAAYRFLVIGHGYGSTTVDDHLPDPALLARIPDLEEMNLSMLVSLGDIVQHATPEDFNNLERVLLAPLPFPVFNTPGNHDVVNRSEYAARYGQTYYSFRAGPAQMVFLDTERENCGIDDAQQKMLAKALARAVKDQKIKHIFIFMHKTLFFANKPLAEINQKQGLPNVMDCFASESFASIMQTTILPAAQHKPVVLFAGDVGAWANLTPYYERRPDAALTMVMTGLGDNPNNAGILVTVDGDRVQMEVYSFTGQPVQPLETYSPSYWLQQVAP